MERFIFQVIEPLISKELEESRHQQRVEKITEQLRAFVRGQLVPLNKELSKKTRELFVASSDVEKLKESVEHLQRESNKLRQEVASRESEIFKQKMGFQRDIQALQEQLEGVRKEMKRAAKKAELDTEHLHEEYRDKLQDLKKEHRAQLQGRVGEERAHWEGELAALREGWAQEKSHLVQEGSRERAKLIKKYEQKLYSLKSEGEELLEQTSRQCAERVEGLKRAKGELEGRLTAAEEECRRLALELEREVSQHRAFKAQFESTFSELEGSRRRGQEERQRLEAEYESLRGRLRESERSLGERIRGLQGELRATVEEKDRRFVETVEAMSTQHRIELDALHNSLLEEREVAITSVEVRAYEQLFEQNKKYERLQLAHRQLQGQYDSVRESYEQRLRLGEEEHAAELSAVQERKAYESELSGENARREYVNLQTKFSLQLRSLRAQQEAQLEGAVRRGQEEKAALGNKLVGQYEAMLADQRSNTEIQIKQKLLQFQRKGRAFEKRVAEGEKRKAELKVTIERMKLEAQMKIESMMEANEKLEEEVEGLHERILELEKARSSLVNDYEFQLLLLRNEMEKLRDEHRQREDDLRAALNDRILLKNKEIARFAERVKQETEELLRKHRERVGALEKEYAELQRVITQKTSLPEDIEALRVFHAAYLEKEGELLAERRRREELQRELRAKDAIERVFAGKEAFKRLTAVDKLACSRPGRQ